MAKPISFEKLEVSLTSNMAEPIGQVTEETPFHMLILGDFSGMTLDKPTRKSERIHYVCRLKK